MNSVTEVVEVMEATAATYDAATAGDTTAAHTQTRHQAVEATGGRLEAAAVVAGEAANTSAPTTTNRVHGEKNKNIGWLKRGVYKGNRATGLALFEISCIPPL